MLSYFCCFPEGDFGESPGVTVDVLTLIGDVFTWVTGDAFTTMGAMTPL